MAAAIHTLIFDLDDTLVVEEATAEATFIETGKLAQAKYELDPCLLHATVRKACRELWYAFPAHSYCKRVGISSWEGMWAEFIGSDPNYGSLREWAYTYRFKSWQNALRRHGIEDPGLAFELAETFPRLRRKKHVVYPDAVPALEQLAPFYALGLLTNGAPDLQRLKIEASGLAGYFSNVLISGDVGFGKPAPRIFELLLARMGAEAETALMIGNSLESDIDGAQKAGMRAVWINRSGAACNKDIHPDWEISNLLSLPALVFSVPD